MSRDIDYKTEAGRQRLINQAEDTLRKARKAEQSKEDLTDAVIAIILCLSFLALVATCVFIRL